MSVIMWLVVVAVTMLLFGLALFGRNGWEPGSRKSAIWYAFTILAALSPLYYEFPDVSTTVVTFEKNGEARTHPYGFFCWEWGKFSNMPTDPIVMHSAVTTLTDNPKIRRVVCKVSGTIVDPSKFYRDPSRRKSQGFSGSDYYTDLVHITFDSQFDDVAGEVMRAMAPHLYRFNSSHSRELATLDNPFDADQQAMAKKLFEPTAQAIEAMEGIRATLEGFALE